MSNNRLEFRGLNEMREALRNLAPGLKAEAEHIVWGAANGAAADIKGAYPVWTGNLRDHLTVVKMPEGRFSAGAVVKDTAKYKGGQGRYDAYLFEVGTKARHYVTRGGKKKLIGAMPAGRVFIPRVVKARRLMYEQIKDLLRRAGFRVSGNA